MDSDLQDSVFSYMDGIQSELLKPPVRPGPISNDIEIISSEIFKLLSSREFTYFTKIKAEPYRSLIYQKIDECFDKKKQLTFYFNLGGGYHAKVFGGLSFEPGFSELSALFQIKKFIDNVSTIYPFGCRFEIIIDNRCAELANGIPIEKTESYSAGLGRMIEKCRLDDKIKVVLESDLISKDDFEKMVSSQNDSPEFEVSDKDLRNACRFCDYANASDKKFVEKYKMINKISRINSSNYSSNGVHLTQRPTEKSFPFRSFPGGDSKIQCGKIAILFESGSIKRTILITTNNMEKFDLVKIKLPDRFVISDVLLAINKNERFNTLAPLQRFDTAVGVEDN